MLPKAALVRSRKAVESLYTDTCRIITVTGGDGIPVITQSVTLFLSPEIDVPAGADVDVVRQGRPLHFKSAGVSAVYDNHQEISLEHREVHDG